MNLNSVKAAALAMSLIIALVVGQATGQEVGTAANFVPEDCSFFMTVVKGKLHYNQVVESSVVTRLMQTDFWKAGAKNFWEDANNQKLLRDLESPAAQALLPWLNEGFTNEIFVCADANLAEMFTKYLEFEKKRRAAAKPGSDFTTLSLEFLAEKGWRGPTLLAGIKCSDAEKGFAAIDKLVAEPLLRDGATRRDETIGKGKFAIYTPKKKSMQTPAQLKADGEKRGASPAQTEFVLKLVEGMKQVSIIYAVGRFDDYVLLAVGPDTKFLARLGDKSLAESQKIAPLRDKIGKDLIAMKFMSKELSKVSAEYSDFSKVIDQLVQSAPDKMLGIAWEDLKKDWNRDLSGNVKDAPLAADELMVLRRNKGLEAFSTRALSPQGNYSAVLSLAKQAGPDPIFSRVWASSKSDLHSNYQSFRANVKKLYASAKENLLKNVARDLQAMVDLVESELVKFSTDVDFSLNNKILPGFGENPRQTMFLLDFRGS